MIVRRRSAVSAIPISPASAADLGRYAGADALAAAIERISRRRADRRRFDVLTGGEPLLEACALGFEIALETNGTLAPRPPRVRRRARGRSSPQPEVPPEAFAALAFDRFSLHPKDGRRSPRTPPRRSPTCLAHPQWRLQPADPQGAGNSLVWEIVKSFRFEAAQSLAGTTLGADAARVHGHSFRADLALRGTPDPTTIVEEFGALAAIGRTLEYLAGRCQSRPRHRLSRQRRAGLQLIWPGPREIAI